MIDTFTPSGILWRVSPEHLFEAALVAALVAPALRAATSTAYRRVFPLDAARLGAISLGYLAVVATLAYFLPAALRYLAIAALAVAGVFAWRARPLYGVARGLPPGSLQPLPVKPWSDAEFYRKSAERYGNVFKMSQFGRPMICVLGLERANRLLLDHDAELEAPPLPFNRFIEGGYLRYLPEETHAQYRRSLRALFHSSAVARSEHRIAKVFHRHLATMARDSASAGAVKVKPRLMRAMFAAWADLFYGIDETHADFARLKALFHVIDTRYARWAQKRRVEPALAEIERILRRRAESFGPKDVAEPASFLAALTASEPQSLKDRTILGNLIYIMQVTWGDVTGLLVWVFKMLSDHPEWQARIATSAARSDAEGRELATRFVQETLRLEQSESRYRRATADLELDGFRIPKGWLVRMCIRESHQDEQVFPNPRAFDPERFANRNPTRGEYAPFGAFRLACIGENAAISAAVTFAITLATGFDWRVVADGPPEINNWAHNAPSPRFSVALSAKLAGARAAQT